MEKYIDQLMQLFGVHGVFAMLATIFLVRLIGQTWYLERRGMVVSMLITGSIVGSLCVYYLTDLSGFKNISGGAFMTVLGAPMLYHTLKWVTALAYEKTKLKTFSAMYFFLTPKPIKLLRKNGSGVKEVVYEPPHEGLTQMMGWKRVDKEMEKNPPPEDTNRESTD